MNTFLSTVLLFTALISQVNIGNAQQLEGKYWVQDISASSENSLIFNAKDSYTKNTQIPYAPLVLKLNPGNKALLFDWGICMSATPPLKYVGTWIKNGTTLIITSPQCTVTFQIVAINDKQLKLQVKSKKTNHSSK